MLIILMKILVLTSYSFQREYLNWDQKYFIPLFSYNYTVYLYASSSGIEGAIARVKVKGGMSGMIVDVDHRVGRLLKLLISAFSLIGSLHSRDDMGEEMYVLQLPFSYFLALKKHMLASVNYLIEEFISCINNIIGIIR